MISYDVSQRTNEIGIRMALGAQPEDVRRMILGQGARLAVYGIVAGLLGARVLTRWMGTMLFGVNPTDAWTFAAISILLAVVALAASYLPSRRATSAVKSAMSENNVAISRRCPPRSIASASLASRSARLGEK